MHIEEAPLTLKSIDDAAGATVIAFAEPKGTGNYAITNTTGEDVTEICYEVTNVKQIYSKTLIFVLFVYFNQEHRSGNFSKQFNRQLATLLYRDWIP